MYKPVIIAGPCAIESEEILEEVAREISRLNALYSLDIIFKSSFDKANRTSLGSYRGPGLEKGLGMLSDVKTRHGLKILTDIHESWQAAPVAEVADIIQIPAFLCRQTDLLVAAAKTGRTVNIKKAQFLSGEDMRYPAEKVRMSSGPGNANAAGSPGNGNGNGNGSPGNANADGSPGRPRVWLTERGNMYGYNNLVVDFRNIAEMKKYADAVIMDCTHSVQRPGGDGGTSGGDRKFVPAMALAAKAFGADGWFFEVHPDPDRALSDGKNMLKLSEFESVIKQLLQ